jgi:hypothetical protein
MTSSIVGERTSQCLVDNMETGKKRALFTFQQGRHDLEALRVCGPVSQGFDDISGHIVGRPSAFVAACLMEISMARRCKLVDARTPRRRQEPREANSIISTRSASGRERRRDNPPERIIYSIYPSEVLYNRDVFEGR